MQRHISSKSLKFPPQCRLTILCFILFTSRLTSVIHAFNSSPGNNSHVQCVLPYSILNQISELQSQVGAMLKQLRTEGQESKSVINFSDQVLKIAISLDKLAYSLSGFYGSPSSSRNEMINVDEDYSKPEESEFEEKPLDRKVFKSAELQNYTSPKPNMQSWKKNFLGLEAVSPSIGLGCAGMASKLDRFMSYKIHGMCPDDWDLAKKLMVGVIHYPGGGASQEHLHVTVNHFLLITLIGFNLMIVTSCGAITSVLLTMTRPTLEDSTNVPIALIFPNKDGKFQQMNLFQLNSPSMMF